MDEIKEIPITDLIGDEEVDVEVREVSVEDLIESMETE